MNIRIIYVYYYMYKGTVPAQVCVCTMFVCVLMSEFVYACMKQNEGATNTTR